MKYIEYKQLNPFQRFGYNFSQFFKKLPQTIVKFFMFIGNAFLRFFTGIGKGFANYFTRLIKGCWSTKLSYLIMGAGVAAKGQIVKGILYLAVEVGYIFFMLNFGISQLALFPSLGISAQKEVLNEYGRYVTVAGDNSMLILLYGVLTIVVTIGFFAIYISNTKAAYNLEQMVAQGKKPMTFIEDVKDYLDHRFHVTLLSLPTILIGIFTVLPLIFMILIAFTNYNKAHMPPGNLFNWVGFQTFSDVFEQGVGASRGHTFIELTKWTIVWAILATASNYIFGMIIALMINKKGIKLKSLWRTLFVITIAVPQFVSLLLMSQLLAYDGAFNTIITQLGGEAVHFIDGSALTARITVLVVNCWIGIPYTILITSGILMNIPEDLYESARIDGAGPVKSFLKITLPYMIFVTTPYLITSFIGNINNFNVIFLLTNGGPSTTEYYQAGYTDLLVTWLFKLTMTYQDYNLAAAVGILVFIVCASLSLITFNLTKSAKDEEAFS